MHKYGFHCGGGLPDSWVEIEKSIEKGAEVIQFFVGDPHRVQFERPDSRFVKFGRGVQMVIHSPYWVSFFNPKVIELQIKYIKFLAQFYASKVPMLYYVTHTGKPKTQVSELEMCETMCLFFETVKKLKLPSNFKICIENSAYRISEGNSPTLKNICNVALEFKNVGICLDTEHAYAAGESFEGLMWDRYDIIHLNGIPSYVRFGGGLDRHSFCLLEKSKSEIFPVIDELVRLKESKFVIFERRDLNLLLADMKYMKEKEKVLC